MEHVLSIDELRVNSNKQVLLDIEQLTINTGMQIAVVGGNGAGKTTLIESLLGLRQLASGQVNWLCESSSIGVQLQQASYNTDMLVKEVILLHQHLYHHLDTRLYAAFNIAALSGKKYGILSRGEKQRVDLYVAMAHNPQMLVLDEPGTGLDKKYYKAFIDKMDALQQQENFTLLMASHSALELRLASHILWVGDGRIKKFNHKNVLLNSLLGTVKVEVACDDTHILDNLYEQLNNDPCVNRISRLANNTLIIYGLNELKHQMFTIAKQLSFSKFSISEIREDDLLSFIGELDSAV
ncbi:ATP-binding cassette domain-containing protein [Thalassotalea fusca]